MRLGAVLLNISISSQKHTHTHTDTEVSISLRSTEQHPACDICATQRGTERQQPLRESSCVLLRFARFVAAGNRMISPRRHTHTYIHIQTRSDGFAWRKGEGELSTSLKGMTNKLLLLCPARPWRVVGSVSLEHRSSVLFFCSSTLDFK